MALRERHGPDYKDISKYKKKFEKKFEEKFDNSLSRELECCTALFFQAKIDVKSIIDIKSFSRERAYLSEIERRSKIRFCFLGEDRIDNITLKHFDNFFKTFCPIKKKSGNVHFFDTHDFHRKCDALTFIKKRSGNIKNLFKDNGKIFFEKNPSFYSQEFKKNPNFYSQKDDFEVENETVLSVSSGIGGILKRVVKWFNHKSNKSKVNHKSNKSKVNQLLQKDLKRFALIMMEASKIYDKASHELTRIEYKKDFKTELTKQRGSGTYCNAVINTKE